MSMDTKPLPDWAIRWARVLQVLRLVPDVRAKQALLHELLQPLGQPRVLAFVNAHAMNMAAQQAEFAALLAQADVVLRDGSGMQVLLRMLGRPSGLNMNGTDFIPELLAACRGKRVALWGTQNPYLEQAKYRMAAEWGVECVSCLDGFLADADYVAAIRATAPQVVILGMGMPKQERIAALLKQANSEGCLVVCGGAILDFLGGRVARAPKLFRQTGLEWLYRLGLEPRRLYRRYVLGNPAFLWRAAKFQRMRK